MQGAYTKAIDLNPLSLRYHVQKVRAVAYLAEEEPFMALCNEVMAKDPANNGGFKQGVSAVCRLGLACRKPAQSI